MKTSLPLGAAAFLCAAALTSASASATTIGFESLADLDPVTTQFSPSGVTFANTIALKAGLSLNDGEFPPHSGSVVISDDGGPMTMLFSTPVTQVGVFFTYALPLTLTAWDVLDPVSYTHLSMVATQCRIGNGKVAPRLANLLRHDV